MSSKVASTARKITGVSHWITWLSSIIVLGITGYFLHEYHERGLHLKYWIIISALTAFFWLPALVLPFLRQYIGKSWYLPLNLIFSYLWLTAFIFAAQDYNRGRCRWNAPFNGSCTLKRANQAFMFLPFFFTMVAVLSDILNYRHEDESVPPAPSAPHDSSRV